MSANLTVLYHEAEKGYRRAQTDRERLHALKKMLATIPKHKGTDKLQADIKQKISKLNENIQQGGKGSKQHFRHHVDREGLLQIAMAGPPNTGKSQLLCTLTHAHPEIADYPYTTRMFLPGIMVFQNYHIQLVDLPAVSTDHMEIWVPEIIKNADAILIIIDLSRNDVLEQIDTTLSLLREQHIICSREFRQAHPYRPERYPPTMIVGNKSDTKAAPDNWQTIEEKYGDSFLLCPISAKSNSNLEELQQRIVKLMNIIRVYSKPPGQDVEHDHPFIFTRGSTLLNFTQAVHHDFSKKLRYARVWGAGKYNGQRVNHDYILEDEDIVELHL